MDQLSDQLAKLERDTPVIRGLISHGAEVIAKYTAQLQDKKRRYARAEDSPKARIPRFRHIFVVNLQHMREGC